MTDILCEQASAVVEYIVRNYTQIPLTELEETDANGDVRYSDRVQEIFNDVFDAIDTREEGAA